MDENPYQSPAFESYSPQRRLTKIARRPISFVRYAAGGIVAIGLASIASSFVLGLIGGVGALLMSFVVWPTLGLCNPAWRLSERRLYAVIAVGASIIFALGLGFSTPWPIVIGCLVATIGLGLFRTWVRSNHELSLIGLWLLEKGNYQGAIAQCNTVLRRKPEYYDALVNRGVANARLGQLAQSNADLDEAIRVRPDLQIAYAHRGQVHVLLEAWDAAIADLQIALFMVPEDADSRIWLAKAHYGRKDLERAKAELEPLFQVVSFRAAAYLSRARILLEQHAYAGAIADYEHVVGVNPNELEAWLVIGLHSAANPDSSVRNAQLAISAATRACELTNWKQWNPISVLAAAHAEARQFDEAVRWAQEALRMAPPEEQATRQLRIQQYQAGEPYRLPSAST